MQNRPIILHVKLLLSLVLRIRGAIKFTVLSSLQSAKTCKTFSAWTELPGRLCRACSLLLEDACSRLHPLCMRGPVLRQPLCCGPGQTRALSSAAQLAPSSELDLTA